MQEQPSTPEELFTEGDKSDPKPYPVVLGEKPQSGQEQIRFKSAQELQEDLEQLRNQTEYPRFSTAAELKAYLETKAPIKIYEIKSETQKLPVNVTEITNHVASAVRRARQSEGRDMAVINEEEETIREMLNKVGLFLEGTPIVDEFGIDGTNHSLRGEWRNLMQERYGDLFRQVYTERNQLKGNFLTYVSSGLAFIAWKLGPLYKDSEEMMAQAEELISEQADYDKVPLDSKIAFVHKHEDFARQTLLSLDIAFTPHKEERPKAA